MMTIFEQEQMGTVGLPDAAPPPAPPPEGRGATSRIPGTVLVWKFFCQTIRKSFPKISSATLHVAPLPSGGGVGGGVLLALLLLSAQQSTCRRRVPDEAITPATAPLSVDFLKKQLDQNAPDRIKTFSAHARIFAEGDGMAVEASANLIWIRDSVLWINIKKYGIEAVRALVTRDSVTVLNRLDKTVQVTGMDALQHEYSLPEGFPLLQHLLLASAWIAPDMALQADIKDDLHRLSGSNGRYAADYRIEEGAFALRQVTFLQQRDARVLSQQFAHFKKLPGGAGIFPYIRRIEAFSPESGNIRLDIEFTDIEINVPKPYRFDIPDHYQRVE